MLSPFQWSGSLSQPGGVVISVEDWAEIRRLHRAEEMPARARARKLGISRNTVRRAIVDDAPPKYQRARGGLDLRCGGAKYR